MRIGSLPEFRKMPMGFSRNQAAKFSTSQRFLDGTCDASRVFREHARDCVRKLMGFTHVRVTLTARLHERDYE